METLTREQLQNLQRYETIKVQMKELETEAKQIAPLILPLVPAGEALNGEFGSFEVRKVSKWEYSSEVNTLETTLKEKKEEEKANGTATKDEVDTLFYIIKK